MHVLYVTTTYPPHTGWGGIGTYVFHMSHAMKQAGYEASVLCNYADKPTCGFESDVHVSRLLTMGQEDDAWRSAVADHIETIVEERGIDVVEFAEYGGMGIEFQRRRPDFPVVVRFHASSAVVASVAPLWLRLARRIAGSALRKVSARERETIERASVLTSCARWLVSTYRRSGWTLPMEPEVIRNPISVPDHPVEARRIERRKRVVSLGRLDEMKGAGYIPGVIRNVGRSHRDAQFRIIGQNVITRRMPEGWLGWIKGKLPEELLHRTEFTGGVPHHEISDRLSGSAVAFFASTFEACPYSHLEAMQMGIPIVIASGGGARELGVDGESVIQVKRDVKAISRAVDYLLTDTSAADRMALAAFDHLRSEFSYPAVVAKMIPAYERAVARSGNRRVCEVTS